MLAIKQNLFESAFLIGQLKVIFKFVCKQHIFFFSLLKRLRVYDDTLFWQSFILKLLLHKTFLPRKHAEC